ncbi:cytochrome P450 [Zopfochytrium polystomum]|nr:cytochrome P450 [Zopfochytrium polystomum]
MQRPPPVAAGAVRVGQVAPAAIVTSYSLYRLLRFPGSLPILGPLVAALKSFNTLTEINTLTATERPTFAVSFDRTQVNIRLRFASSANSPTPSCRAGAATTTAMPRLPSPRKPATQDLLTLLARMQDDDGSPIVGDPLAKMLMNYLFAGRDTTGVALSWVFLMLERHPPRSARGSWRRSTPRRRCSQRKRRCRMARFRGLPYANAVMCETMRLYPTVPVNIKEAVAEDMWPNGVRVWFSSFTQCRSVKLVFNAGPLMCLGKNFAGVEIVFVLVELLRRFEFKVEDVGRDG